mmetsp:Transcript_30457/g.45338  ORF Transcript_30457/g.45338 Transcript_30457/m.45338 type:complete len:92 (-) Transcript_30457:104-379(-)
MVGLVSTDTDMALVDMNPTRGGEDVGDVRNKEVKVGKEDEDSAVAGVAVAKLFRLGILRMIDVLRFGFVVVVNADGGIFGIKPTLLVLYLV